MSVYISFTNWAPISGPFWDAHTIGLENYHTFLTDHVYWHSVFNTIYYAVGSVAVVNLVALPMALLLNQKLRGLNIFRTIFYMPAILPAVAVVLVFRLILFPGPDSSAGYSPRSALSATPPRSRATRSTGSIIRG
jgi:multiple sugar transport system permease protein